MTKLIFEKIKFDEKGLVPAIAQDYKTKEVLMLAWMNEESIQATIESGLATYFSRSRNEIWQKGKTSGNIQEVKEMILDCDNDCILLKVKQTGPACHTGEKNCFFKALYSVE